MRHDEIFVGRVTTARMQEVEQRMEQLPSDSVTRQNISGNRWVTLSLTQPTQLGQTS